MHSHRWGLVITLCAVVAGAQACNQATDETPLGGSGQALSAQTFFITEIAQSTAYGGSTADKVEVYCADAAGCPAFRVCDPTSTGGTSCAAVQSALPSGGRAVVSRGTNITTEAYEQVWIEDCSGTCAEISGTRVSGPFPCASGQSVSRADCASASFGACSTPDLGNGVACSGGTCGDLVCDASETCSSCPGDCGACSSAEPFEYSLAFAQNQHGTASSACTSGLCTALKGLIDGATTSIDFAIYGVRAQQAIIDALSAAEARGVSVRGIVDSENDQCGSQGSYTYPDTPTLIGQLAPGAVVCDNGSGYGYIMHDKFFILDGRTLWTGSTNVSDTETGGEINGDVVATFTSEQLASIYETEFQEMYSGLFHHNKTDNTLHVLGPASWTDGTTVVESYFAPTDDATTHAILRMINDATGSLDVAIFYLTDDGIGDALVAAHDRGVQVRVVIDATGAAGTGSEKDKLCTAGIPLKVENWPGKQHSKWGVADGRVVVFGSQNWTAAGNADNDENTLYVDNTAFAAAFVNEFARQWDDLAGVANCASTHAEGADSPGSCSDGVDNDYDGYIDCSDFDCNGDPACAGSFENTPAACNDGIDNDGDSYVDCDDFDCGGVGVCAVVVNECLPEPQSGSEWIELFNTSAVDVDASAASVDDTAGGSSPQALGAGSVVPAHGFLLVNLNRSMLNNSGSDQCRLLGSSLAEIDALSYSNAPAGQSWARMPDGTGAAVWDASPTPGSSNH